MKKGFGNKTWKPTGKNKFNPTREQVQSAVDDYLKNGGTIKRVTVTEEMIEQRWMREADEKSI